MENQAMEVDNGENRAVRDASGVMHLDWKWVAVFLISVAVVFLPHLRNGFVYDDHAQIVDNEWVGSEGSWLQPFTTDVWHGLDGLAAPSLGYYRPVFTVVNRIIFRIGGGTATAFHAAGVALHLVSVCLIAVLLSRLGVGVRMARAAALLFCFHPLVGDVVFWAGCLSEQLMLTGFLACFVVLLEAWRHTGGNRSMLVALSTIFGMAALLSKETALVIAPVLTIAAATGSDRGRRRRLLETIPIWTATAVFLALRSAVLKSSGLGQLLPDWWTNLAKAGTVVLWEITRLLVPYPMTLFHELPAAWESPVGRIFGLSVILGLVGLGMWIVARRPRWSLWAAWIVLPLLPPLTQLFFVRQTGLVVADRYLLMSLVPWCAVSVVAICAALGKITSPPRAARIGAVLLAAACAAGGTALLNYGGSYSDDQALFSRAAESAPDHPIVLAWLAKIEMDNGRPQDAIPILNRAIEIEPRRIQHYLNLGLCLARTGRPGEAVEAFREALRIDAEFVDAHLLLADALRDSGRVSEAVEHYETAHRLEPANVPARINLGTARYLEGDIDAAIGLWESVLADSPDQVSLFFNLGMAWRASGNPARAAEYLRRFLNLAGEAYGPQRESARRWLQEMGDPS